MQERIWVFIGAVVLVLFTVLVTAYLVHRREEKRMGEFQDIILKKQREEVQNIYQTMRGWRHDYHNHMQIIKAYLDRNQVRETLDYLEHLEEDLDSIDIAIRTGNVSVDAILSSKVSIASKRKIEVNYKAVVPKELQVSDVHLCAIIGNLLDNAIEACEKVEESKRFIRVYLGVFKGQLYISVTNATNATRRRKLYELITEKQGEHGLGLKRIDRIAASYDGYVNRKNEPGVFATEVLLPL
ncbi:MAG: GHKL domain-containing protein [Lachnospiraceae bacterium]|nr:GHKL domain-containing protein [Lachnospiraceae bacterium]